MADALKLLSEWPGWARANSDAILASPAWRLETKWGEEPAVLRRSAEVPSDALMLKVALDGDERMLALADSELFADLHQLWARRRELPQEVLLALIEKECGGVFQLLENVFRRSFSVRGLAEADGATDGLAGFELKGNGVALRFAIGLAPVDRSELGRLTNIDTGHESIRSLVREAEADYGAVELEEDSLGALVAGDLILLPEAEPSWRCAAPSEGACRILGARSQTLTFAQFADGDLPPVPSPDALRLVAGGRTLATGGVVKVGQCAALRLEGLADEDGR